MTKPCRAGATRAVYRSIKLTHCIGGAGRTRPTKQHLYPTLSSLQNLDVGCTVERAKSGLNIHTQFKDDQTKSCAAALAATLPSSVGTR